MLTKVIIPIATIKMKQPLIHRQVMMAKQLPLTTLPINDWQHDAQECAAIPTELNPKR